MPTGLSRPIFHFTHVDNLSSILEHGMWADNLVRSSFPVVECAHPDIKERRRSLRVKVEPFGVVADYVPFYLATRSPMMYRIHKGTVPGYDEGQDPLIYLVSTIGSVVAAGRPWVGSDGNCAADVTEHANSVTQLEDMVDWPLLDATRWANTADDGDRMRRRQAELLVHRHVPSTCIAQIITRVRSVNSHVVKIVGSRTIMVGTDPGCYY